MHLIAIMHNIEALDWAKVKGLHLVINVNSLIIRLTSLTDDKVYCYVLILFEEGQLSIVIPHATVQYYCTTY